MVETHKGYLSFPKGKLKKGESEFQAAVRELEEETGIKHKQITIIDGITIEELSDRGNPSVKYWIGTLDEEITDFRFRERELAAVFWMNTSDALNNKKLKDARKNVLKKAIFAMREPRKFSAQQTFQT